MDFAEILAAKRPHTEKVEVVLDPDLADAYAEARKAHTKAKAASVETPLDADLRAELADAEDALEAAEDAVRPSLVTFVFKGLPLHELEDLKDAHRPTKEQKAEARREGRGEPAWNEDTFPPALVAAASADPVITPEQAEQMWKSDNWNQGELQELFWTAKLAQSSLTAPDLGKGSGLTRS